MAYERKSYVTKSNPWAAFATGFMKSMDESLAEDLKAEKEHNKAVQLAKASATIELRKKAKETADADAQWSKALLEHSKDGDTYYVASQIASRDPGFEKLTDDAKEIAIKRLAGTINSDNVESLIMSKVYKYDPASTKFDTSYIDEAMGPYQRGGWGNMLWGQATKSKAATKAIEGERTAAARGKEQIDAEIADAQDMYNKALERQTMLQSFSGMEDVESRIGANKTAVDVLTAEKDKEVAKLKKESDALEAKGLVDAAKKDSYMADKEASDRGLEDAKYRQSVYQQNIGAGEVADANLELKLEEANNNYIKAYDNWVKVYEESDYQSGGMDRISSMGIYNITRRDPKVKEAYTAMLRAKDETNQVNREYEEASAARARAEEKLPDVEREIADLTAQSQRSQDMYDTADEIAAITSGSMPQADPTNLNIMQGVIDRLGEDAKLLAKSKEGMSSVQAILDDEIWSEEEKMDRATSIMEILQKERAELLASSDTPEEVKYKLKPYSPAEEKDYKFSGDAQTFMKEVNGELKIITVQREEKGGAMVLDDKGKWVQFDIKDWVPYDKDKASAFGFGGISDPQDYKKDARTYWKEQIDKTLKGSVDLSKLSSILDSGQYIDEVRRLIGNNREAQKAFDNFVTTYPTPLHYAHRQMVQLPEKAFKQIWNMGDNQYQDILKYYSDLEPTKQPKPATDAPPATEGGEPTTPAGKAWEELGGKREKGKSIIQEQVTPVEEPTPPKEYSYKSFATPEAARAEGYEPYGVGQVGEPMYRKEELPKTRSFKSDAEAEAAGYRYSGVDPQTGMPMYKLNTETDPVVGDVLKNMASSETGRNMVKAVKQMFATKSNTPPTEEMILQGIRHMQENYGELRTNDRPAPERHPRQDWVVIDENKGIYRDENGWLRDSRQNFYYQDENGNYHLANPNIPNQVKIPGRR